MSGPTPARVDAATKSALLGLVAEAVETGWTVDAAITYLQLPPARYYRWRTRAAADRLDDLAPGGGATHGLLAEEVAEILKVLEKWGPEDQSYSKLAHRGSYSGRFWASPASVRRVLNAAGQRLPDLPRSARGQRRPLPGRITCKPNDVWLYDTAYFASAGTVVLFIQDFASCKWLSTVCAVGVTSVLVELGYCRAWLAEGLNMALDQRVSDNANALGAHRSHWPLLGSMGDNGPRRLCGDNSEPKAPGTIEQLSSPESSLRNQAAPGLFGDLLKAEYPQLNAITDPVALRCELEAVQVHWNTVRLHEAIGYVTPDDEYCGRGPAIRQAREEGLKRARERRIAARRTARQSSERSEHDGA